MKSTSSPPPYRVGRSRTGLGLFATELIKKGKFIVEYTGKKIANKVADELNNKYLFEINSRWTIDGSPRSNIARYINHSCRPNAESDVVRGVIKISSIKTIHPGDEITYHYGKNYFDMFIKPVGCKCEPCRLKRRAISAARRAAANGAKRHGRNGGKSGGKKRR